MFIQVVGFRLILLGWAFLVSSVCTSIPKFDDSLRVKRVREFVVALNSKDIRKMESFLQTQFRAKDESATATTARAKRFLELASLGSPFSVDEVLVDKPQLCIVRLSGTDSPASELKIEFEQEEPYRAISVYMGGLGSQTGPPPSQYTKWRTLTDLLTKVRQDTKVPGISLAFFHDGREEIAVVGNRKLGSNAPVAATDRWLIGSITKSMTATMIARLVDQGVLRWDSTIEQVLPNIPMKPGYRKATLLQILQHRAGIPQDQYVNPDFLSDAAGTEKETLKVRDHYAQFTLNRDPIFNPGEQMRYSNAGYALAAHMAEVMAKKPYEQLMNDLLFRPLKMKSAHFGVPGQPGNPGAAGQIMGHTVEKDGLEPNVLEDPRIAGIQAAAGAGLSMTIGDLMTFIRYHLEGRRGHAKLMSQENFNVLHRPGSTRVGESTYSCGWVTSSGFTREPFEGHNGSDGTFRAEVAIWPNRNLAIVSITNAGVLREPAPTLQAVEAVYERIDGKQRN